MKRVRRTIPPTFGAEIASCMVLRCIREILRPDNSAKRRCYGYDTKTTNLDQRQNNRLPKG